VADIHGVRFLWALCVQAVTVFLRVTSASIQVNCGRSVRPCCLPPSHCAVIQDLRFALHSPKQSEAQSLSPPWRSLNTPWSNVRTGATLDAVPCVNSTKMGSLAERPSMTWEIEAFDLFSKRDESGDQRASNIVRKTWGKADRAMAATDTRDDTRRKRGCKRKREICIYFRGI